MTTEIHTTEATTTLDNSPEEVLQKTVGSIVEIGRVWANHGLGIGRSALDASMASLKLASTALAEVQARLNPEQNHDA